MRRAACAGDDGSDAALVRFFGVVKHIIRHAMGGDHFGFIRHAELFEHFSGLFHDRPVGVAAHEDTDDWSFCIH